MTLIRTQWFCCKKNPPAHPGTYEMRLKPRYWDPAYSWEMVLPVKWTGQRFLERSRLNEAPQQYEWRGLAVRPETYK
jgi:hypothetical protein